MWPVFVMLCVGAMLIGVLSVPCISLRAKYLFGDDNRMSIFQMKCEQGLGNRCLCTQQAGDNMGGDNCRVGDDMVVTCQANSIEFEPN